MENIINKYIEYLDEIYFNENVLLNCELAILKSTIIDRDLECNEVIENKHYKIMKEIDVLEQIIKRENGINFNIQFRLISKYLEISPLNVKEQVKFIFYELRENISNGILEKIDKNIMLDPVIMKKCKFTKSDVIKLLSNKKYLNELELKSENLTSLERRQKYLLEHGIKLFSEDNKIINIVNYHKILEDHYFNKIEKNGNIKKINYNSEDIEIIIDALENLGVSDNLCKAIRHLLEKDLEKQISIEKKQKRLPSIKPIDIQKENNLITDKEYRQIKKEIKNYFNTYTLEFQDNLTEEEVLYCASLMLKIEVDKDIIRTLFRKFERTQEHQNPITNYLKLRDKLKFYQEKCGLEDSIELLDETLKEIFITTDKDYEYWKKDISQILDSSLRKLPENYEYELDLAAKCKIKK